MCKSIKNALFRTILIALVLLQWVVALPSQEIPEITSEAKELFDIYEPKLIEKDHKLFIAKIKQKQFPYRVLFLLDGNAQFSLALNAYAKSNIHKPMLIVGLGYNSDLAYDIPKRKRDYIPSGNQKSGAEAFYQVLQNKILLEILEQYPIDSSYIGLFGHSFGGIFGLYAAFYHRFYSLFYRFAISVVSRDFNSKDVL